MTETLTFRVVGGGAAEVVKSLNARVISSSANPLELDVYEVKSSLHDPVVKALFKQNSENKHGNWVIGGWKIDRTYDKDELDKCEYLHWKFEKHYYNQINLNINYFEFHRDCTCKVPVRQIFPIVANKPLRSNSALVRTSIGAILVRTNLAAEVCGDSTITFTPVFESLEQMHRWKMKGASNTDMLQSFAVDPDDLDQFHWVQMHPQIFRHLSIVTPTDGRKTPHVDPSADLLCNCHQVYGPGLISELYLQSAGRLSGDWLYPEQFVGSSSGIYFPYRPLVVSQKAGKLMQEYSRKMLTFEPVHLVQTDQPTVAGK